MPEVPDCCNIHGIGLIRIVRKVVRVDEYNLQTKEYEPTTRPWPREFDREEFICQACGDI